MSMTSESGERDLAAAGLVLAGMVQSVAVAVAVAAVTVGVVGMHKAVTLHPILSETRHTAQASRSCLVSQLWRIWAFVSVM